MWTKNEVTNQLELTFQGELISVGENVLSNSNGTEYRVGSVKIPNGTVKSCRIYEKNYTKGMNIGVTYRCTATQYQDANGDTLVDIQMSHLTQAERATLDDFGVTAVVTNAIPSGQAI
jgi:hypothetical protein